MNDRVRVINYLREIHTTQYDALQILQQINLKKVECVQQC